MHTKIQQSLDQTRIIELRSTHRRSKTRSKPLQRKQRHEAEFGTKSYSDGLQRAFNVAKSHVFFNPDMTYFVTLTYGANVQDLDKVLLDMKVWLTDSRRRRRESGANVDEPKYIWVAEYQKRGAIHVHMVCNRFFPVHVNQNGYESISNWPHGFTSVLSIRDFDSNFRPYLYLFKYMKKAQRIGRSFVHTSKNLTNYRQLTHEHIMHNLYDTILTERTETTVNGRKLKFFRDYKIHRDTMQVPIKD